MRSFSALASTSPTSTPPSWVNRIQSPCTLRISYEPSRCAMFPSCARVRIWESDAPKLRGHTYVSHGVYVNVVFSALRMGNEWFNEELSKVSFHRFHLLELPSAGFDPFSSFGPCLVKSQETALTTTLDQLIWFGDKSGAWCK